MQIAVGLGLSTLDKSMFGFRKSDRSSRSPTPDGQSSVRGSEVDSIPELPPLGMSEWNNSFINLLDKLEISPSSDVSQDTIQPQVPNTTPPARTSSVLSSKPSQHNAKSSSTKDSMEFMTTETYFSKLASCPPATLPTRQQSSTSSTTISKRSDSFSVHTASSRSSLDDTTVQITPAKSLETIALHPLNTDLFADSFLDTKLDLALSPDFTISPQTPLLNTNKPLPPAPSAALRDSQAVQNGVPLPELDSGSVSKRFQNRSEYELDATSTRAISLQSATAIHQVQSTKIPSPRKESRDVLSQNKSTKSPPQSWIAPRSIKKRASGDIADRIVLQILLSLQSLSDLKAVALVNRSFYRIFKRHESKITENVLRNESMPAWELRQLVCLEQKRNPFQLKAIQRDVAALRTLEAFILMRCGKICGKRTVEGLTGEDPSGRSATEDALWRIWTFCKLFGKGTSRDATVHTQIMWLEGLSHSEKKSKTESAPTGRTRTITRSELENMSEMWHCMEMLLSGFRGREAEAREAGIFDQCKVGEKGNKTETQFLEDWICDILSVGPKAVLTMISCSFEQARVLGVNKWTPPRAGRSRRTFLKAALEQVYRDRLVEEASLEAEGFAKSMQLQTIVGKPSLDAISTTKASSPTLPQLSRPMSQESIISSDDEMVQPLRLEIRPDCDPEAGNQYQSPVTSPTTNPSAFSSLSMMSNASTRMGATLFPIRQNTETRREQIHRLVPEAARKDSIDARIDPKVVDPTDRALSLLVKQLGFPISLAKQALAMSDDGAGIDVQRAVELLSEDRRLEAKPKANRIVELPTDSSHPVPAVQQSKDYCEGTCRRVSVVNRKKTGFRGLVSRTSFRQSLPLDVIMDDEDQDSAVGKLARSAMAPAVPISMPTVHESPLESKPGYHNLAEFLRYRSSLRSQSTLNSQGSFRRGHRKSSSLGSTDWTEEEGSRSESPVSPLAPALGLGGFTVIKPQPQPNPEGDGNKVEPKPRVTLTRVGTGKKPSKRISLTKRGSRKPGEPPEIIGYTY